MSFTKLYLVGGTVRDFLLGVKSGKDYDFAVEAVSYESMLSHLTLQKDIHVWQERPEFVTLRGKVLLEKIGDFGGMLIYNNDPKEMVAADFTLCRAEAMYHDNRHPSQVTPAPLVIDLSRRDFTINAVAVDEMGNFIDPFNGVGDAGAKLLRTVGRARERFEEDPLRMLRAIRFIVKYDLRMDAELEDALWSRPTTNLLSTIPTERVREELNRALQENWFRTMTLLLRTCPNLGDSLAEFFPSLWFKATTEDR